MSDASDDPVLTITALYVDIVGHTRDQKDDETEEIRAARNARARRLNAAVDEVLAGVSAKGGWPVRTFTGDGVILTFEGDATIAAGRAVALARLLRQSVDFQVRMGINTGPVAREDVGGEVRLMGAGMDVGQRVLNFCDGDHILLSRAAAESIRDEELRAACLELGTAPAKHDRVVELLSLHGTGFGNPGIPRSLLTAGSDWHRRRGLRLSGTRPGFWEGALDLVRWLFFQPARWAAEVRGIDPDLEPNFTLLALTSRKVRANPDLRELLARSVAVQAVLLGMMLIAFGVWGNELRGHPGLLVAQYGIAAMLLALFVGVGASLAFFVVQIVGEIARSVAGLVGPGQPPEMLVVALCQFLTVIVLSPLLSDLATLPGDRRPASVPRELAGIMAGLGGCGLFFAAMMFASFQSSSLLATQAAPRWLAGLGAGAVVCITAMFLTGARTASWSRAYTVGSLVGLAFGLVYGASIFTAGNILQTENAVPRSLDFPWGRAMGLGLSTGVFFSMLNGTAFICGLRVGDAVAGLVAASLWTCSTVLIDHALGMSGSAPLTIWHAAPIPAVLVGWTMARRRVRALFPSGNA